MQPAVCDNGDVLLYNGSIASVYFSEGTVLVCYDNEYGTVCDDFWDTLDASVVCNQLHNTSMGECLCVLNIFQSKFFSIMYRVHSSVTIIR